MSDPRPTHFPHQPIEITREEFIEAIRERDAENARLRAGMDELVRENLNLRGELETLREASDGDCARCGSPATSIIICPRCDEVHQAGEAACAACEIQDATQSTYGRPHTCNTPRLVKR